MTISDWHMTGIQSDGICVMYLFLLCNSNIAHFIPMIFLIFQKINVVPCSLVYLVQISP